jgi:hypothetical protein
VEAKNAQNQIIINRLEDLNPAIRQVQAKAQELVDLLQLTSRQQVKRLAAVRDLELLVELRDLNRLPQLEEVRDLELTAALRDRSRLPQLVEVRDLRVQAQDKKELRANLLKNLQLLKRAAKLI